ncbi:DUF2851 family protein [Foetidibacter luteolus]|uniref:DUF2851 family protein n=1 Tax=Foetidibacter luteolus TaxID=2608880 RepID=UPI001F1E69EE|nr:DUF2851 family protein [Foetidibacter luteolus]
MITERLLQFIWQFQYFSKKQLQTVNNESLQVIYPGQYNTNQGPDFSEAKIRIDATILVGNIELHVYSSHWQQHAHTGDANYSNVVLHVVWQHDKGIALPNGAELPTLELQPLVPVIMLQQYEALMNAKSFIACGNQLPVLSGLGWMAWKERLLIERLSRRAETIINLLGKSNGHWEETFWWLLARNFGITVNAHCFEELAKTIPVNVLAKHKNQLIQLEALLLGQALLLEAEFEEEYPRLLQREYQFLKKMHKLAPLNKAPMFLRMRPANFPTLRLAQLAALIYQAVHLFSKVKEAADITTVKELLDVTANDYWHYHYKLDEASDYKPKKLGGQMVTNIIINTVVPVLFAYGVYSREQHWKDKAVNWLMHLPPEQNKITAAWKERAVLHQNAFDSQALLELKKNYCDEKRCLDCAVGNKLLRAS